MVLAISLLVDRSLRERRVTDPSSAKLPESARAAGGSSTWWGENAKDSSFPVQDEQAIRGRVYCDVIEKIRNER